MRGKTARKTFVAPRGGGAPEDGRGGLFTLDAVLPSQFGSRSGAPQSGEKRLLVAVLKDAVDTIIKCRDELARISRSRWEPSTAATNYKRRLIEELMWVERDNPSPATFSLGRICEVCGLDQEAVRERIRRDYGRSRDLR